MNSEQIKELFEKHEGEGHKFERVENKLASRADVHAFVYLDKLFPGSGDLVCSAEHDQIWLGVGTADLEKLTEENIIELRRCGVWWEEDFECLSMFV